MNEIDWQRMYILAEEILSLAPWKTLFEEDLFAIQPRAEGPTYFVSVMGSRGEHHAIAFYPGLESLSRFRMSQLSELPESIEMESFLLNGHLQVAFYQRKYLLPQELKIFKANKKAYRGKWPVFRSHRPARQPWITNAEEAADLTRLMEQTLIVLRRAGEDLLRPYDEEEFFLRTWDGKDSICRVADLPVHRHIIQAPLPAGALNGLEKTSLRLEADLIWMTTPILDVPPGEAPYFPLTLLVADSASGLLVGAEIISTVEGVDAAYARIPKALTGVLRKAKLAPAVIRARHPILLSLLESYRTAYGIEFESDDLLPGGG